MTPPLACTRYELTNPMMVSATCGWLASDSLNHVSIFLETPNPLAMAKTTATMGTMASSVE